MHVCVCVFICMCLWAQTCLTQSFHGRNFVKPGITGLASSKLYEFIVLSPTGAKLRATSVAENISVEENGGRQLVSCHRDAADLL